MIKEKFPPKEVVEPKYAYIFDEKICKGKDYKEYCKQFDIKVPTAWFGTIRKKRASVEKL